MRDDLPDELKPALEKLLQSYSAASPRAEAEARWRLNLRTTPATDRCLGFSARAWALACVACLLLACGMAAMAWVRSAPPAPRIVFSPPPAPVFVTPAVVRAAPQPAAVQQPAVMTIVVPRASRVATPTPQEILLTRLVEEKPAALAQMFKDTAAPLGEPQ